jgi:uncharacterized protein
MKLTIEVRVTPNAKKERWVCGESDALKFYTTAQPVDGKANQALINSISKLLKTPKSGIELILGNTSKTKLLKIETSLSKKDILNYLLLTKK